MEKVWYLKEVCSLLGGGVMHGAEEVSFSIIAYDSRRISSPADTLFVALSGLHHDGHQFLDDIYQQGIRAFLVSKMPDIKSYPGAGFCMVDDTLAALQDLASQHRKSFRGEVAAIAGSNGKTIVKEWIYQMLSGSFRVYRSPLSFNSQLGVPLSVLMMAEHHELAVIEAGISQPGEMEKLGAIIGPDIGLFTNLGTAHQENFDSLKDKLYEKLKLFRGSKKVILRSDRHLAGEDAVPALKAYLAKSQIITWSIEGESDYVFSLKTDAVDHTQVYAITPSGPYGFNLPFIDEASVENALHAYTFAVEMGLSPDIAGIKAGSLEPVSMRMELLQGINNTLIVNDSYNADIAGLEAALDLLNQQKQYKRKILILSDLLQSGMDEYELYQEIALLIGQKGVSLFIGVGKALIQNSLVFPPGSLFFVDTADFLKRMDRGQFREASILIKGSRKFGFEQIAAELQLKTHQTRLEVDLNSLVSNLNYYRSLLADGVKLMVMVKALSYGSGSVEVASLLQYHKVDYLAVAFIDEGIELRKAGIRLPIMVMNPDPSVYGQMLDYHLEPEIFSFRGLEALYRILHYREIRHYPIHLKVDTGMHRLGFADTDLDKVKEWLNEDEFRVVSVFSHLAASDEVVHDGFTRQQIDRYQKMYVHLCRELDPKPDRHILNSSGIERFPDSQFEMVRLGIGLHGIGFSESLLPASSFKTTVSQVRNVARGETIGYSRSGKADSDMQIATLPVGYADGMDRRLGNGKGLVWIRGKAVPTVGNICMDMSMIDVSGLEVAEGDEVELFGKNISILDQSRSAGTIPYEILTSIPERVKRVYLQE